MKKKKSSRVLRSSVFVKEVEEEMPLESDINIEPEMFLIESTERSQRHEIKKEPLELNEILIREKPHDEHPNEKGNDKNFEDSNDETCYGPLESDIKIEPEQFSESIQDESQKDSGKSQRDQKTYVCDFCGVICSGRKTMYSHMNYMHLTIPYLFCDLCPKSFKNKTHLKFHIQKHKKYKDQVCDICGHKTKFIHHLAVHKLTHGKKTECTICHRLVNNLKDHIRSHKPKKLSCKICGHKFSRPDHLNSHILRIHEQDKPCRCDQCSEAFRTKFELKRHFLRAHYDKKIYECRCGVVFKTSKSLYSHKRRNRDSEGNCNRKPLQT